MDNPFLKFDKEELDTMKSIFTQEVKGLNTLRSANTSLVIPEVISHNNSYLLLEYLEEETQGNDFQFGVDIARGFIRIATNYLVFLRIITLDLSNKRIAIMPI